jgi:hypothetical protein
MTLKPCRGGCGTDLLDPDAPNSFFGVCVPCLEKAPTIEMLPAWREIKERRINRGLDPQNLTELVDEEAGYRNVVVGGVETLMEQERYA